MEYSLNLAVTVDEIHVIQRCQMEMLEAVRYDTYRMLRRSVAADSLIAALPPNPKREIVWVAAKTGLAAQESEGGSLSLKIKMKNVIGEGPQQD